MAVSSPEQEAIANHLAAIIPDGATLQMGIGGIPDAVLRKLRNHRHLGIHTELFSDGVVDLVEAGVITNERKTFHPGKIIAGFVLGTQRLYDFVDDNPIVELHPSEYVNDPFNIAKNDRMVSINSAIQVDLTGQVCADSIGTRLYSGVGGQVDFVRGAARSQGGMPIIAFPSTARGGQISRIVPTLEKGAGVVTTRNDVHYIATEYGVAELYGRTVRERAMALVEIAHPKFRAELAEAAEKLYRVPRWFVRFVLFHELLHAALGAERDSAGRRLHHGPRFRAIERAHPDHERALRWERRHLGALLRSARGGRPLRPLSARAHR